MDARKKARLEATGWSVGSAEEFLACPRGIRLYRAATQAERRATPPSQQRHLTQVQSPPPAVQPEPRRQAEAATNQSLSTFSSAAFLSWALRI